MDFGSTTGGVFGLVNPVREVREVDCKRLEMTPEANSQQSEGGKSNSTPPANNTVEIFDDEQAACYVGGVKARAIRDWRTRRGLPYLRLTAKVCRIRKSDLDKWLAQHRVATMKGGAQ